MTRDDLIEILIKRIAALLVIAIFLALHLGEGARGEVGTMTLPKFDS